MYCLDHDCSVISIETKIYPKLFNIFEHKKQKKYVKVIQAIWRFFSYKEKSHSWLIQEDQWVYIWTSFCYVSHCSLTSTPSFSPYVQLLSLTYAKLFSFFLFQFHFGILFLLILHAVLVSLKLP